MLSKGKRPYDPQTLGPRTRLRRNVQDMVATNVLSSGRLVELATDINRVDGASFPDIARISQGHNMARDLKRKFVKSSTWMPPYWCLVRCANRSTSQIERKWICMNLVHELVHVLEKQSIISKLLATDGMCPHTRRHYQARV